jgi:hypothetical protein
LTANSSRDGLAAKSSFEPSNSTTPPAVFPFTSVSVTTAFSTTTFPDVSVVVRSIGGTVRWVSLGSSSTR